MLIRTKQEDVHRRTSLCILIRIAAVVTDSPHADLRLMELLFLKIYFMCMHPSVSVCAHAYINTLGVWKRVLESLKLELQVVVSHRAGAGNQTLVFYKSSKWS